ncbi:bifunctional prephenate dehydrogenase/3-phosphoshikimate 1-carboxyvinyltransferase, partial [bacterium]|nr:bifunctional prephenate dehydrogenase/3-phosphoshikimate 1-carboxyvinyltransferase [bacterium]
MACNFTPLISQEQFHIRSIPGDKSISHRAIIIASLADNKSQFTGFLFSEDCLNTLQIFQQLGVSIVIDENTNLVTIHGVGLTGLQASDSPLDVGNSGTGIRLITGILAMQQFESSISGD